MVCSLEAVSPKCHYPLHLAMTKSAYTHVIRNTEMIHIKTNGPHICGLQKQTVPTFYSGNWVVDRHVSIFRGYKKSVLILRFIQHNWDYARPTLWILNQFPPFSSRELFQVLIIFSIRFFYQLCRPKVVEINSINETFWSKNISINNYRQHNQDCVEQSNRFYILSTL